MSKRSGFFYGNPPRRGGPTSTVTCATERTRSTRRHKHEEYWGFFFSFFFFLFFFCLLKGGTLAHNGPHECISRYSFSKFAFEGHELHSRYLGITYNWCEFSAPITQMCGISQYFADRSASIKLLVIRKTVGTSALTSCIIANYQLWTDSCVAGLDKMWDSISQQQVGGGCTHDVNCVVDLYINQTCAHTQLAIDTS